MKIETAKYLHDILRSCRLVRSFTRGKTYANYHANTMLRSAVERQFEIMGEAMRRALETEPDLADELTDARRIIGFRNILAHGYATVNDKMVWGIIELHVASLQKQVAKLLNRM